MTDTETETPETEPETVPETPSEPETDDEPGEEEDTPETAEEPQEPGDEQLRQQAQADAAQTEAEVKEKNDKLRKEAQRHANRIEEIMGSDSEILVPCPLCLPLIPGWRYPQVPQGDQFAAVKEAIGEPAEPTLKRDPYSEPCLTCDGAGAVDTTSKVTGRKKVVCLDCGGFGFKATDPRRATGQVTAPNGPAPAIDYNQTTPPEIDPPEVEALKALGYIVVPPIAAPPAQVS